MGDESGEDILKAALETFDKDGNRGKGADLKSQIAAISKDAARNATMSEQDKAMAEEMSRLMADLQRPEITETLNVSLTALGKKGTSDDLDEALNPFKEETEVPQLGMDANVATAFKAFADMSSKAEGMDSSSAEQMGENLMQNVMNEFQQMSEKEDFSTVVDEMMRQLLSKDVMYLPMKQITEKFPTWLASNQLKLSPEDYMRHGKMYQSYQRIIALYESEPDNLERLIELFQDMQEYGPPPSEIIKDLAPGLEFGENGLPVMPGLGTGAVPGMGGMAMPEGAPAGCTIQ